MSEENNTGQEQTENAQAEEQTSKSEQESSNEQPDYHKAFTKDEWKEFSNGFFQNAYNESRSKTVKDLQSLGIEADSYEDAINTIADKLKPKQNEENKGEVEQLRERLQAIEQEKEQYATQLENERKNMLVSSEANKAKSELSNEGDLKLGMDKVQRLFELEHDIQQENGQYYVSKDGMPVLDDHGNRKSIGQALKDFVVSEELITPNKKGVGGGTGGAASISGKPKFSEFQELVNSQKSGDRQRAAEMRAKAKDIGWDDEDNPKTFRRR